MYLKCSKCCLKWATKWVLKMWKCEFELTYQTGPLFFLSLPLFLSLSEPNRSRTFSLSLIFSSQTHAPWLTTKLHLWISTPPIHVGSTLSLTLSIFSTKNPSHPFEPSLLNWALLLNLHGRSFSSLSPPTMHHCRNLAKIKSKQPPRQLKPIQNQIITTTTAET